MDALADLQLPCPAWRVRGTAPRSSMPAGGPDHRGARHASGGPSATPAGRLRRGVDALVEAGLGHVGLGRPTATLSGGEVQRLGLCTRLLESGGPVVHLLDEPGRGLHPGELDALLALLQRLVERGAWWWLRCTGDVSEAASLRWPWDPVLGLAGASFMLGPEEENGVNASSGGITTAGRSSWDTSDDAGPAPDVLHASAGPERCPEQATHVEVVDGGTLLVAMRLWRSISIGDGDRCSCSPRVRPTPSAPCAGMESGVPYSLSTDSNGTALLMNTNSPTRRYRLDPVEDHLHAWICCSPAAHAGNSYEPGPPPVSEASATDAATSEAEGVPALAPDPCRDEDRQASLDRLVALWQAGDLQGLRTQSLLVVHDHAYVEAAYLGGLSLVGQGESTEAMAELSGLAAAYPGQPIGWRSWLALAEHLRDAAPAAAVPVYGACCRTNRQTLSRRWHGVDGPGPTSLSASTRSGRHAVGTERFRSCGAHRVRKGPTLAEPTAAKGLACSGLGHLYAGSPRQALSAFIVNSVFAGGGLRGVPGSLGRGGRAGVRCGVLGNSTERRTRHDATARRWSARSTVDWNHGLAASPHAMPTGDWNPAVQAPD